MVEIWFSERWSDSWSLRKYSYEEFTRLADTRLAQNKLSYIKLIV